MARSTIPYPWRQYEHPNGDIYYYNPLLRLITPEDIRNTDILEYIMDARDDHLQCLAGDPDLDLLPPDYELVVSDVSDTAAVLRMYSRMAGAAYDWTEERGLVFFSFLFCLDKHIHKRSFPAAGLVIKTKEHFWSHVAEYPTHHSHLPPNTEREFVESISNGEDPPFPFAVPTSSTAEFFSLPLKKQKKIFKAGRFSPLRNTKSIKLSRDIST